MFTKKKQTFHYVCSDIHGRYDRYKKLFEYVNADDDLFIVGDVMDRHPDGLAILRDIMTRKNITFFFGNHEQMLYYSLFHEDPEVRRRWTAIWTMPNNGGSITMDDMLLLDDRELDEIRSYLEDAFLFKRITVNKKKFHLSHGCAMKRFWHKKSMKVYECTEPAVLEDIVWVSPLIPSGEGFSPQENYETDETFIVGHKYVQNFKSSGSFFFNPRALNSRIYTQDNIIDIDGGCALPRDLDPYTSLILYRLEDGQTTYIK